jgi:hypothetical protein
MKIAEALLLRSDLKKQLDSLQSRISKNLLETEDIKPTEDATTLLNKVSTISEKLAQLIYNINFTNVNIKTPKDRSLTSAMAIRESLIKKHDIFNKTIIAATPRKERNYNNEKPDIYTPTVDTEKLRHQVDQLAMQIREINAEIQETNWANDLIE